MDPRRAPRRAQLAVLAWALCAASLGLMVLASWMRYRGAADATADGERWAALAITDLGLVGVPVVGAVIASRVPRSAYGWVWCALGLTYALTDATALATGVVAPWVADLVQGYGFLALLSLSVFVFLLFPTGHLPGPRWVWVARGAVVLPLLLALVAPFAQEDEDPAAASPWVLPGAAGRNLWLALSGGVYVLFLLCLAAMASALLRFRRAGPVERQQLKWFAVAGAVNALVLVADLTELDEAGPVETGGLVWAAVSAVSFGLLPVAVGLAVLRHRLYEIDRIISRTVSYGVLTAALVGLYVLVVSALRGLLEPVAGTSQVAVVVSTLVVAAVFQPARRRVHAGVDARFDRAHYDAARAVQRYAARLRSQVDLDEVTAGLRETVADTVGPSRVAVWVRDAPVRRGA